MAEAEDVWCEVEVLKGDVVSVYRGRLTAATLAAWRAGELANRTMTLQDTYWSYVEVDGNDGWVVVGATPGPYARATGTMHVRADLVLVIVPLRDGAERETHTLRPIGGATRDDDY